MFLKIGVLKNFANFSGKNLRWSLFLIKLQVLGPATLLKKRLQDRSFFFAKFAKFLRTFLFYRTLPVAAFGFSIRHVMG